MNVALISIKHGASKFAICIFVFCLVGCQEKAKLEIVNGTCDPIEVTDCSTSHQVEKVLAPGDHIILLTPAPLIVKRNGVKLEYTCGKIPQKYIQFELGYRLIHIEIANDNRLYILPVKRTDTNVKDGLQPIAVSPLN